MSYPNLSPNSQGQDMDGFIPPVLHQKLQSYEAEPDDQIWDSISSQLNIINTPSIPSQQGNKPTRIGNIKWLTPQYSYLAAASLVLFISLAWVIRYWIPAQKDVSQGTSENIAQHPVSAADVNESQSISPKKATNYSNTQNNSIGNSQSLTQNINKANQPALVTNTQIPNLNRENSNFSKKTLNSKQYFQTKSLAVASKGQDGFSNLKPGELENIQLMLMSKMIHDSTKVNSASYFYQAGLVYFLKGNYCKSHAHLSMAKTLLCNRDLIHTEVEKALTIIEDKISQECICMADEEFGRD